jgi:pilus assembly protein Flp/PilA
MKKIIQSMWTFLAAEEGPTAVEYAVMIAMIVLVCLAAVQTLGISTMGLFQSAANSL